MSEKLFTDEEIKILKQNKYVKRVGPKGITYTGLQDTRKGFSGRPLKRELSLEEQIERLEAKNKFLKVQLEFQKKLDMIERGVYTPKSKKKHK